MLRARTNQLPTHTFQAGDVRLTDTRADEAERGITIKSTGISLYYEFTDDQMAGFEGKRDGNAFLINLIDSPGMRVFVVLCPTSSTTDTGTIVAVLNAHTSHHYTSHRTRRLLIRGDGSPAHHRRRPGGRRLHRGCVRAD